MTVLASYLPVLVVDDKLGALVLANLAPGINGVLLLVEVTAAAVRSVSLDIPPPFGLDTR